MIIACVLNQISTSRRLGKDAKILGCLASGASTSSAPASILTGADEERCLLGIVGGTRDGGFWYI